MDALAALKAQRERERIGEVARSAGIRLSEASDMRPR